MNINNEVMKNFADELKQNMKLIIFELVRHVTHNSISENHVVYKLRVIN